MSDKLDAAVEDALSKIRKEYGNEAIFRMSDQPIMEVDAISTQSMAIDAATGIGGIPKGRITEIFGPESQGKTTLALHIVAAAQREGNVCFIDVEHSLDPTYAKRIGVNVDDLYLTQPDYAEQALEIMDILTRSGAYTLIVLDSVAALVPKEELEGTMDKMQIGLQARVMSKALRKLTGIAQKSNTTLVFINQVREKIGVMWGNPESTPGGRALKFYSTIRLDIRRRKQVKKVVGGNTVFTAIDCMVKVAKNKVAPPFKMGQIRINFGTGIDRYKDLFDFALKLNIIKRGGSIYKFPWDEKVKGEESAINILKGNVTARKRVRHAIIVKLNPEEFKK